jgi:hypothetical protein
MIHPAVSSIKYVVRQPGLWGALVIWCLLSVAAILLCRNGVPLDRPELAGIPPVTEVLNNTIGLFMIILLVSIVAFVARCRPWPHLAERAPDRRIALREGVAMWIYGAVVLLAGRILGQHYFGEGIALHLNGCLFGATHVQSPTAVYTWAAYNGIFLAFLPYLIFRWRGYSLQALNLRSINWKNDALIIAVVMLIGCAYELAGPNIFQLTPRQQLVGGALSLVLHLCGTDLPIMIFIYAILLPRYARLFSPLVAFLVGAVSYPLMHVFESWTRYDSLYHAAVSVIFVLLTFFPAGVMKSFSHSGQEMPGSICGPSMPSLHTSWWTRASSFTISVSNSGNSSAPGYAYPTDSCSEQIYKAPLLCPILELSGWKKGWWIPAYTRFAPLFNASFTSAPPMPRLPGH